jgi:hypothetical protein
MDSAEQQVVDRLKQARNILVTVRNNPTVDLLSACIGLALGLDKMGKHVAAVFSGEVPSTIEFLKPEETIEQNPDSLRDFIIALDKSKADKLRYKVEDKIVRIFITPYKTSLSQDDLQFSQGDFNVDAVVALGAHEQQELDQSITSHGRILHDATVMSINNTPNGNLGAINWQDLAASSISELVAQLIKDLDKAVLDEQIATALLTGIVAETDRFSNEKTTPRTMSLAGDLMSAGANQQLVATQLKEQISPRISDQPDGTNPGPVSGDGQADDTSGGKTDNGTLQIDHQPAPDGQTDQPQDDSTVPGEVNQERDMLPMPEPPNTNEPNSTQVNDNPFNDAAGGDNDESSVGRSYLVDEPNTPSFSPADPGAFNPLDLPSEDAAAAAPLHDEHMTLPTTPVEPNPPVPSAVSPDSPAPPSMSPFGAPPLPNPSPSPSPTAPPSPSPVANDETLEEIEESVHSPHLQGDNDQGNLDAARHEVAQALQSGPAPIEPLTALNAAPLGEELHAPQDATIPSLPGSQVAIDKDGNFLPGSPSSTAPELDQTGDDETPLDMPLPPLAPLTTATPAATTPDPGINPQSPPPVPPPFMPPTNLGNPSSS